VGVSLDVGLGGIGLEVGEAAQAIWRALGSTRGVKLKTAAAWLSGSSAIWAVGREVVSAPRLAKARKRCGTGMGEVKKSKDRAARAIQR